MSTLYEIISDLADKDKGFSDIHIKSGFPSRSRINGDILKLDFKSPSDSDITGLMYTIDDRMKEKNLHTELDTIETKSAGKTCGYNFSCSINSIRYRGNLSHSNGRKLYLVLRRLSDKIPQLEALGLPTIYKQLITKSNGLCLITGATGSGKSTTLASTLDYIIQNYDKHIETIEDPVEYVLKESRSMVSQKEVGTDVPSFEAAMRDALRQDPDIVMLGEIRDAITMRTAMSMAETGHLVFGTLHTNGAVSTVERCVSFFEAAEKDLARNTLGTVLNFVLSQSLAKRKDGTGRIMAYELMVKTTGIKQNIMDNKTNLISASMETGSTDGQVMMSSILIDYINRGLITKEEALSATNNYDKLKEKLR